MKLYVARHGETTWNLEGRLMGNVPGDLTAKGIAQAEELALHIQTLNPDLLITSDLQRALQTTEIITQHCPGLPVKTTAALRERNFGDMEGKPIAEVDQSGFWEMPADATDYNAESLEAFTRRIATFTTELCEAHKEETVLLVTHIGVMNRLNYLQDPENFAFTKYTNADAVEFDLEVILKNSHALLSGTLLSIT